MKYLLTGVKIIDQTHLEIVVRLTFRNKHRKKFTRLITIRIPGWLQ
jgi:hypothetical protein